MVRRALIVTGGAHHEHVGFSECAVSWLASASVDVTVTDIALAVPGSDCDLLVVWTCHAEETPELRAAYGRLTGWLRAGGRLLALHSATVAAAWHTEWRGVVGAVFDGHPEACPVRFTPAVCDSNPLAGFEAVTWRDEPYRHRDLDPACVVLLDSDDGSSVRPGAWRSEPGAGRVIYFAGGHGKEAWQHPQFGLMVRALAGALLAWG